MPTANEQLASGALAYLKFREWEQIYAERARNFGSTMTIVPLGDPRRGAINATTFTTRAQASGSAQTATWATAPSAMATPFKLEPENGSAWTTARLYGPAGIPGLVFDGSTDALTIPDAAYWTRALVSASWVACISLGAAQAGDVFSKGAGSNATREWRWISNADRTQSMYIFDSTAVVSCNIATNAAVSAGVPHHVCFTYDGAANASGMLCYVDGVSVAVTATNNGSFVTMRDLAQAVAIGETNNGASYFAGNIFGGPFGPAFVQVQLSAQQILDDFRQFQASMGLG